MMQPALPPCPAESLEALITGAAGRCLRAPAASLAPDVPLSLLGMDSLAAIEMAAELEGVLGQPLPDNLLEECTDIRSIVDRLRRLQARTPEAVDDRVDRLLADAVLPADVRPPLVTTAAAGLHDARRILLTGATGFLGSWLARELLESTSAPLICLVRPAGARSGRERLRAALTGLDAGVIAARIHVIEADLSHPRLGLAESDCHALAHDADAICHAGAAVNWVYSYAGLRSANVSGTLELLRLACIRGLPFHFVSSLSVCYSTSGPRQVDERFDPLRDIRGVHLGYAQAKAVADALVLEAGRRGLPVRIYRPALISGDSRTGAFNREDLLSTLIRGCVHMGTAPDLDWQLDCQPVDWVARAIVGLSAAEGPVFHLAHQRPRHWRECALWMRLYGYPIRLVPYHAWLRQLDRETAPSACAAASHPLRPLRSFFLDRPPGARGLTLPELYEEGRRARADHARTDGALGDAAGECPPLDAGLLDTYFGALRRAGALPAPEVTEETEEAEISYHRDTELTEINPFLCGETPPLSLTSPLTRLTDGDSIIADLTAWRSRRPTGLFRAHVQVSSDAAPRDAIVKMKARDTDVIAVGEALARLCDPAVGELYARWRDRVGLTASHLRELAIYRQTHPRFVRHVPGVLGTYADPATGTWLVVLETITDGVLVNSAGRPEAWDDGAIGAAVDGLAALQAIWYGREAELRAEPWLGPVPCADSMAGMSGLWTALADHAAPAFSSWADPSIAAIQHRLIAGVACWWSRLEHAPRTLIHNDFNPRNVCLRGEPDALRLCAYDWELATLGAPQRDLVELLCFVLPSDVSRSDVERWLARHRDALERETGAAIDPDAWRAGFAAALCDMLINRLAIYALINRVRRQPFLPGIVRTWRRLYRHFPLEAAR